MRRLSAMLLAASLVLVAACGGGPDDTSTAESDGASRRLFQPAGVIGPDSFSPSFAAATYQAAAAARVTDTSSDGTVNGPAIEPGSTASGSTPGLYAGRTYGGTGANICDVEKMIAFLTFYEDRGRAWAAIHGIAFEGLGTYLRDLTPVFTLQNLNVTMFGFKNGKSYGYDAVLEAGTAILIDDQGMPRARCACGNPLLGPSEDIPEGTDEPTPDEPVDGNPQTQDSVPPETDGAPDTTIGAPDTTDGPVDEQPIPDREPACPDWNAPNPQYVDTNGMAWLFNAFTGKWISLDDPTLVNVPAAELPGFSERCVDADRQLVPECPSPTDEGWTPYQNAFGETFEYALLAGWTSTATGARFGTLEEIPGYLEECGAPGTSTPCPPRDAPLYSSWTAPDGSVWYLSVGVGFGAPALRWENLDIPETVRDEDLYERYCGNRPDPADREPVCPPTTPALNAIWIDANGDGWVYAAGKGGVVGWDNVSTEEIEVLFTSELPNAPDGCDPQDPPRHWACPPILNIPEGSTYEGADGSLYVWTPAAGGWIGREGNVVVYTVLLPGFRQRCLPPCPPIDAHEQNGPGVWVDPSSGDIWIKPTGRFEWINISSVDPANPVIDDVQRVGDTASLPFWTEECLPPCAPGTTGEPTFARDEDGRPVDDSESSGPITIDLNSGVTVTPSDDTLVVTEVFPEFLRAVTATGDDCNPNGCVDLTEVPALGHYFIDSYGVAWRYSDDDIWQSENGESVYSVFDIPGYGSACLSPETTSQRDCPVEFEGTRYTDSRNITWTWVGTNATPEESTHEKKWFTLYADGSHEYRYTFQLDPFLADCPKPDGLDEPVDAIVSVGVPRDVCAGDTVSFKIKVIEIVTGTTFDYAVAVDGEMIASAEVGDGIHLVTWSPTAADQYEVSLVGRTSRGQTGEYSFVIDVVDCGTTTTEGDNTAPIVELGFFPSCVEAPSIGSADLVVFVVVADADGDSVTVVVSGGSPDLLLPEQSGTVEGSGESSFVYSVTADYAGQTLTFDVVADDGVTSTRAQGTARVESVGGCSATPATIRPPATSTTPPTTTRPPATSTTPPTTTRPPVTTTTAPPTTTSAPVAPNSAPDVSYDLDSRYDANNQLCTVRVSAVDTDRGQTVSIGVSGDAVSSTAGEVTRVYTIRVQPNDRGSLPSAHAAFDSAGARVPLSFTVEARLGANGYSCVRV